MTVRVIPHQLIQKNDFAIRLQQSLAKLTVYGNRRIHSFSTYIILIHAQRSLRLCESQFFQIQTDIRKSQRLDSGRTRR